MDIKQLLLQKLGDMPNVKFGYLFGSYNDGTFNSRSIELELNFELSRFLKKDVTFFFLSP
jgi:hypothetical protein